MASYAAFVDSVLREPEESLLRFTPAPAVSEGGDAKHAGVKVVWANQNSLRNLGPATWNITKRKLGVFRLGEPVNAGGDPALAPFAAGTNCRDAATRAAVTDAVPSSHCRTPRTLHPRPLPLGEGNGEDDTHEVLCGVGIHEGGGSGLSCARSQARCVWCRNGRARLPWRPPGLPRMVWFCFGERARWPRVFLQP